MPNNPPSIKIGVIAASTTSLDLIKSLYKLIVEVDINNFIASLPKDRFTPPIRFEFKVEDAKWSPDTHQQLVETFHNLGINLIIGGGWSSMAEKSLPYINNHDMLLISASSTAPSLAKKDNLFRLVPDDLGQAKAVSRMMLSKNVKKAVVLQRDDLWGNGLFDAFKTEFIGLGGTILTREKYAEDCVDFIPHLNNVEAVVTGASDEGVLMLSFDEAPLLLKQPNYPKVYSLPWFGADGTALSMRILEDAPVQACNLRIYSTLATATPETEASPKYLEMKKRYEDLLHEPYSYYTGCNVDAGWLLALGVLVGQGSNTPQISVKNIVSLLPGIASIYYGYSGWCLLNESGDRMPGGYDIWGYRNIDGVANYYKYGVCDAMTGQVTWYPN